MKVLHVASEMTPFAKVGGLGDVLMGLTRELTWRGLDVEAVLPHYGSIDMQLLTPLGREDIFETQYDGSSHKAHVRHYRLFDTISVGLLDTEAGFWKNRGGIYGGQDEVFSFVFFCRAMADWFASTNAYPDILHAHDWQTSMLLALCRAQGLVHEKMRSILTIHNLEYQGLCSWDDLRRAGITPELFLDSTLFQDPTRNCLNLLKGGILSADYVTTVSPSYAREVLTPEGGAGLHEVILKISDRFHGVLNGLDYTYWNPSLDTSLFTQYGCEQGMAYVRKAKRQNKERLFAQLEIPLREEPLIASVTRLVPQKGTSLIRDLFLRSQSLGVQCILLGTAGSEEAEKEFAQLNMKLRQSGTGAVVLKNDEAMAHRLYAAADLFVVPSHFEPCGLTQLIALKYGAVPIVRRTGGLADTIIDLDGPGRDSANGFCFDVFEQAAFEDACQRALTAMKNEDLWCDLMCRGMRQNFSWESPGANYKALYEELLS